MQQKFIINEEIIMNEILNDTILTDKWNYYLNNLLI